MRPTNVEKRYYLACLDLAGRSCLVVGGGKVGLEKARGLLECGAVVTVVAPQIEPELQQLPVRWRRKRYETEDLAGNTLVVAATPVRSVNHRIFRDAEERSMLVNVVDTPELCSFILPAVYRRDPIALAVSTLAAPRLRWRSACATSSGPGSARSTSHSPVDCATSGRGRSSTTARTGPARSSSSRSSS